VEDTSCLAYAVYDKGNNESQFFTVDPATGATEALGPLYRNADIEGMDKHPVTNVVYVTGKGPRDDKALYTLDIHTGALTLIGGTGFQDVDALAFHPDGALWAWSKDVGLLEIDLGTGTGTLRFGSSEDIEGLTWDNQGGTLYAVAGDTLWSYDPRANALRRVASNLPKHTEALDTRPDGLLVGAKDNEGAGAITIFAYDVDSQRVVASENIVTQYDDVESLAWPAACGEPSGLAAAPTSAPPAASPLAATPGHAAQ
jgi:hypothetical protein